MIAKDKDSGPETPVTLKRRCERLKKYQLKSETHPPNTLNQSDFLETLNLQSMKRSNESVNGYGHIDRDEIINVPPKEKLASICDCTPKDGCNVMCSNQITSVECHPKKCPAKEQCQNQKFRKSQLYDTEIRPTQKKGFGLFAMEPIPLGEFVCEYVGQVINSDEFQKRFKKSLETGKFYYMSLQEGFYIDSERKGNKSRFANHSCAPNTQARK